MVCAKLSSSAEGTRSRAAYLWFSRKVAFWRIPQTSLHATITRPGLRSTLQYHATSPDVPPTFDQLLLLHYGRQRHQPRCQYLSGGFGNATLRQRGIIIRKTAHLHKPEGAIGKALANGIQPWVGPALQRTTTSHFLQCLAAGHRIPDASHDVTLRSRH